MVLFLHRERHHDPDDDEQPRNVFKTQLTVAKQRNGPTGMVNLMFVPEYAHFDNLEVDNRE